MRKLGSEKAAEFKAAKHWTQYSSACAFVHNMKHPGQCGCQEYSLTPSKNPSCKHTHLHIGFPSHPYYLIPNYRFPFKDPNWPTSLLTVPSLLPVFHFFLSLNSIVVGTVLCILGGRGASLTPARRSLTSLFLDQLWQPKASPLLAGWPFRCIDM